MINEDEWWGEFFVGRREKVQRHFGCILNRQLKGTCHVRRITITGNTFVSTSRMDERHCRALLRCDHWWLQARETKESFNAWNPMKCEALPGSSASIILSLCLYSTPSRHLEFVVLFLLFARHIKMSERNRETSTVQLDSVILTDSFLFPSRVKDNDDRNHRLASFTQMETLSNDVTHTLNGVREEGESIAHLINWSLPW